MKKYNAGNLLFFAILIAVGIAFYILPNKPTVSEKENRNLATAPKFSAETLLSGEFASGYETYFADNFPFREQLIDVAADIKQLKGTNGEDDYQVVVVENVDDAVIYDRTEEDSETEDGDIVNAGENTDNPVEEDEYVPDVEFEDGQVSKGGFIVC